MVTPLLIYAQLAELQRVSNNGLLSFRTQMTHFNCHPYGVLSIDEAMIRNDVNHSCKLELKQFYDRHRPLRYFTLLHTELYQYYSIQRYENSSCEMHVKGRRTLASLLVARGLAIVSSEYRNRHIKAQLRQIEQKAKEQKRGIWENPRLSQCIVILFQGKE